MFGDKWGRGQRGGCSEGYRLPRRSPVYPCNGRLTTSTRTVGGILVQPPIPNVTQQMTTATHIPADSDAKDLSSTEGLAEMSLRVAPTPCEGNK